ncbi:SEC14-like protein 1 family protein [Aphelenchoides besseyi]|nr:SEC14-like protein 1 family protein [Aphelenchoides besseyi]
MVQTYQSPVRIYKHPFELVMAAYQMRFPTCPQIPIFVGSEIVSEYHSEDGAEEVIERKCQLNVEAPYLVKKIAGVDYVYFTQKNSLDRRKRTLVIEATNISFASRVGILEKCYYYVHPENNDWTCFEQNASLDVKSFYGFESTVEKLAVKQYGANLAKGKEILEHFIEQLIKNGTTYIPPFSDSSTPRSPGDSAIDVSKVDNEDTDGSANSQNAQKEKHEEKGAEQKNANGEAGKQRTADRRISNVSIQHKNFGLAGTSTSGAGNETVMRSPSFDDAELKLESEYIQRFLGQLTPLEESRMCELKYGLQSAHKGKLPNDAHLLRFLRARDFDVGRARDMVVNSLLWRKQHNIDKLLHEFVPPPILTKYFPGAWHQHDKQGRPLFILRLGQMDVKGLLRSVGLEVIVKYTLSICEEGLLKTAEATRNSGKPIGTWTLLVDLEGLGVRHLWRPGVQGLLKIIETVEHHYPETLGLVLIARAPRIFPVLWTLISPFIDETTRKKFMINSNENIKDELKKYIDEEYLPDFLGGLSTLNAPVGGLVPKSEYLPLSEVTREDDVLTSTYTVATFHKNVPLEVCLPVSTAGSVLTWDIDVIKGACEFALYHTNKMIEQPVQPHSPSALNPVELVTAAISASSNSTQPVIYSNPELKIGENLTLREKEVVLSEGDSMQGSHYCALPGTYILQWRICDQSAASQHHSSFDFSLMGPKCKVMYYFELLDSNNFRGSVASLESCRSSFSSLAQVEGRTSETTTPLPAKLHSSLKPDNANVGN